MRDAKASDEITQLLRQWSQGDPAAMNQLMPLVLRDLRKLAGGYLKGERPNHTLQPTALINEAYLRLVAQELPEWQSRNHFFGVAAQLMRQILVDHARSRTAAKRGQHAPRLSLEDAAEFSHDQARELVDLDDALRSLARLDARKSLVVELRYFGGLTVEEIATTIGVSTATVTREMRVAQAWLLREMEMDVEERCATKVTYVQKTHRALLPS
jgi:RNA polymerase sigma factor (TIGR02999 family)